MAETCMLLPENDVFQVVNGASLLTNNTALLYGGGCEKQWTTSLPPKNWSQSGVVDGVVKGIWWCMQFKSKLMKSCTVKTSDGHHFLCVAPYYLLPSKHPEILQEATLFGSITTCDKIWMIWNMDLKRGMQGVYHSPILQVSGGKES